MDKVQSRDVTRILRDVLSASGLPVTVQRVEQTPQGWLVTVKDRGDRLISTELPDGPPALIRASLTRWFADQ